MRLSRPAPAGNRLPGVQLLGVLVWLGTIALWIVFLYFNPYSRSGTVGTYVVGMTMIAVAAVGVYSSWLAKPSLLYFAVVLSLCPEGLYTLLTPGVFCLIGLLNLVALVCAVVLHRRIRTATGIPESARKRVQESMLR